MKNSTTTRDNKQGPTGNTAKGKKGGIHPQNYIRPNDVEKLIWGRHGGWCGDATWTLRYFSVAMPAIVVSRVRWLDKVCEWTVEHLPALVIERGLEWVKDQARACHAKPRRTARNDVIGRRLEILQSEVIDFGLETLTAASRPKKVRDSENRARRNAAKKAKRALVPGYTPREASKAALARAKGTTADAIRAKERRAKLKAKAAKAAEEAVLRDVPAHSDRVSSPTNDIVQTARNSGNDRVSGPTITLPMRPGFGPNITLTERYRAAPFIEERRHPA